MIDDSIYSNVIFKYGYHTFAMANHSHYYFKPILVMRLFKLKNQIKQQKISIFYEGGGYNYLENGIPPFFQNFSFRLPLSNLYAQIYNPWVMVNVSITMYLE